MRYIFFVLLTGINVLFAQSYLIDHDINQVTLGKQGNYDVVDYTAELNGSSLSPVVGAPDLPVYIYVVPLPSGLTVKDFSIDQMAERELSGDFLIQPRSPAWSQFIAEEPIEADPLYYSSSEKYPEQSVQYMGTRYFNGQAIAHFAVHPLRYMAADRKLYFIERLRLDVLTTADSNRPIEPLRIEDQNINSTYLSNISATATATFPPRSAEIAAISAPDSTLSALESGLIDRYIIITSAEFAPALKPLAEWKTRKGVPTIIRTLNWINENFPEGVDEAERMRNYIRWAYQKRGTKYVLLAGDVDIVPTRLITTGGYTFAADYYFSDLDGNWNANQNDIFGQAADQLDGYPEMWVARIPVHSTSEIESFIAKLFLYEKLPAIGNSAYPSNVLYLAANLSKENDGRDLITKHIDPQINPAFNRKMMTQSADIGSNPQVVLNELNKSYAIIFSESHGLYHTIRPGAAGSNIFGYQMDALTNPYPALWYIASCYTNDILKRSFSENFILNPTGGGVAYIGNSGFEYPFSGIYLQKEFFKLAFQKGNYHLSEAHYLSRLPYLGYLSWEGPSRIIVYSTLVLGDPEMPIWTEAPQALTVLSREEIIDDKNHLTVSVLDSSTNAEVDAATVVLYRENEVYRVVETAADGLARFASAGLPSSSIKLTVTKHNYKPYESDIFLSAQPNGHLRLAGYHFQEVSGNGNQLAEPGEAFELSLLIVNESRGLLKDTVHAQLSCFHPLIAVEKSASVTAINLSPKDSFWLESFRFRLSASFLADTTVSFLAGFQINGKKNGQGVVPLEVRLPQLKIAEQTMETLALDSINSSVLRVKIFNFGKGAADSVQLRLSTLQDSVFIDKNELHFGDIQPQQLSMSEQSTYISHHAPVDSLKLTALLTDKHQRVWSFDLNFSRPLPPTSIKFKPAGKSAIEINWTPSPSNDVMGYLIYRRSDDEENLNRITDNPVANGGYFLDEHIAAGQRYFYTMQTVDLSGNFSAMAADTITAWPALSTPGGFPIHLPAKAIGSEMNGVVVYDFDDDQQNELVVSGANGLLQIFRHDGLLLHQLDGLAGALTVPAVANVYGDPTAEVVVSSYREASTDNFVYIINALNGTLIAAISLQYNAPTSVVLKDIDRDGLADIVLLTHAGNAPVADKNSRLLIWRSSGSGWQPFSGWTDQGYVFSDYYNLGVPAAADLDRSGEISVIVGTASGKLFAFKPAQSAVPVWIRQLAGYLNAPVSLADVNADGNLDIVVPAAQEDKLFVLNHLGEALPGWENGQPAQVTDPYTRVSPAIIGNLDEDQELEIVYVGRQKIYLFEHDGSAKNGWPVAVNNGESNFDPNHEKMSPYASPVLADLNQDGVQEIVFITTHGVVNAIDSQSGLNVSGFPIDILNNTINGQSPVIDDLDRDGDLEALYIGHEGILNVWEAPFTYTTHTQLYWNQPFANIQHTGELDTLHVEVISSLSPDEWITQVPKLFYLQQNYPNPFNPRTTICFGLPVTAQVEVSIYNIAGQCVKTLMSGKLSAGNHSFVWNGNNEHGQGLASGVYFYRLEVKEIGSSKILFAKSGKMVFLK